MFGLRVADELPIDALDRAVPDRPALILDDLGHAVWTNSLGLEAARIDQDTEDPQGGVLHRDPETGRLTGLLLEDAQQLVRNAAGADAETVYSSLLDAMAELNSNGVTAISDAGGYWAQDHPAAWRQARGEGPDAIDPSYHDFLSDSIGDRAFDLIPTEALLDAGATVTLSSDWDADPLPPLGTIQRSLTRADNAMPDLATALRAHTVDAAYALGHDDTTGSIEIGKFADFVVLDQDLFDLDPGEIEDTGILATYLGGTAVFEAAGWQG